MRFLCTNASRKGVSNKDAAIRALSIRDIVKRRDDDFDHQLALRAALSDSSVYVRRTAAHSLLVRLPLSGHSLSDRIQTVTRSMYDSDPTVVASATFVAWVLHQSNFSISTGLFKRLVSVLPNLSEFGQFFGIEILYHYCVANFSTESDNPLLHAFLTCIRDYILPYTGSASVVEASIASLLGLSTLDSSIIWSHVIHSLNRLPVEFSGKIFKIALKCMSNESVSASCPVDHFFVRFSDTVEVAKSKIAILKMHAECPHVLEQTARIILREYLEYIQRMDDVIGEVCVAGIAAIGMRFPDLSDIVLKILITLICDVHASDTTIAKSISELRELLTRKSGTTAPVLCLNQICDKVHLLVNDNAKISALWLMTVYHDSIALVVPNVLRAMGATLHKQSSLVKLQLCILADKSLKYFQNTDQVGSRVIGPLKELVGYIFAVSSHDELVGDAMRVVRDKGLVFDEVVTCDDGDDPKATILDANIHSGVFENDHMQYIRPERDLVSWSEEEDEKEEKQENMNVRNMSSEKSAVNRTSAKVMVPSSVKPITTLEDLDLFFSTQEPNGIDVKEEEKCTESPVKATIDLTDLC